MVQSEQISELDKVCAAILLGGETLATMTGVSAEELDQVYARGYDSYQAGRYDEALIDFTYLVMHQPWDRRFHIALGSALQQEKEYHSALKFYCYALFMDACDPGSSYAIAQCLLALGEVDDACEALQTAIDQSYTAPEHFAVGELARKLLDQVLHG